MENSPHPHGMRSTASQGGEGRIYNEETLNAPLPNPLLKGEGTPL